MKTKDSGFRPRGDDVPVDRIIEMAASICGELYARKMGMVPDGYDDNDTTNAAIHVSIDLIEMMLKGLVQMPLELVGLETAQCIANVATEEAIWAHQRKMRENKEIPSALWKLRTMVAYLPLALRSPVQMGFKYAPFQKVTSTPTVA